MKLNVHISTLPNGLKVVTVPVTDVDSATLGVWIACGGRHEPALRSGIAHFIEHLLFKGTRHHSAKEISEAIEGRGGYFNAFTQEESTCYYARVAAEHAESVFRLLAEMYAEPLFAPDDIERERDVILEEIALYNDQPQHAVEEMLGAMLWPNHALGRPLTGTEKTVKALSRKDLLRFKHRHYRPNNTIVLFVGKTEKEQCERWVRQSLGNYPAARVAKAVPFNPRVRQLRFSAKQKDVEQTHLAMGFRIFGRHDPRRFALKLLSVILGENMSSRLFQVVREQYGLAYSIQSAVGLFADTGVLTISAGVDVDRTEQAMIRIANEVSRLKREKVGQRELRRAKEYTIGQLRIGLENTGNQLLWVGENLLAYGRVIQPEDYIRKIQAVNAEEILHVARTILTLSRSSFAMISPHQEVHARVMFRKAVSRY